MKEEIKMKMRKADVYFISQKWCIGSKEYEPVLSSPCMQDVVSPPMLN
jgi:hypothetical protein